MATSVTFAPLIQLDLFRDQKGYELAEGESVIRGRGGDLEASDAFQRDTSKQLCLIFSRITSPGGMLEFVNRFGPLTLDEKPWIQTFPAETQSVAQLLIHAEIFRIYLQAKSTHEPIPDTDHDPGSSIQALIDWDSENGIRLVLRPRILLDALYLQLMLRGASGAAARACVFCSKIFSTGPNTGRRADARFCSRDHQVKFNSLKRGKSKEVKHTSPRRRAGKSKHPKSSLRK